MKFKLSTAIGSLKIFAAFLTAACVPQQQATAAGDSAYGYVVGNFSDSEGKNSVPVKMPEGFVSLLEYNDSPGLDPEKWRTYKPSKRTFQSPIMSFGIVVNYKTGEIFDSSQYPIGTAEEWRELPNSPWVDVGISSGRNYQKPPHLNKYLEYIETFKEKTKPEYFATKLPDKRYGLTVYANPNINPATGRPWTDKADSTSYYFAFDDKGNAVSAIDCSNRNVPHPPCEHHFDAPDINVNIRVFYDHFYLGNWQQIEAGVRKAVYSLTRHPDALAAAPNSKTK